MGGILFSLEKFWISIIYIRSRLARAMKIFLKGLGQDRAFPSFSLWSFETSDILFPKLEKRRSLFSSSRHLGKTNGCMRRLIIQPQTSPRFSDQA